MKKYSEQIIRHQAIAEDGRACEILERITYERAERDDGGLAEPTEVSRRYDLRTGERVNRLSELEFRDDLNGTLLRLQP
jgi:hypothetical protein